MDEQDRQDGNDLVLVRDLSSTRRVAQNSPTIVVWKETCIPSCLSCLSCLSMLVFPPPNRFLFNELRPTYQ
jgi:hypothetical protein